jgi:hypothetical protein
MYLMCGVVSSADKKQGSEGVVESIGSLTLKA